MRKKNKGGRPKGEPTKVMRVPKRLIPKIKSFILNPDNQSYKDMIKKEIGRIFISNKGKEVAFTEERLYQLIDTPTK